MMRRTVFPMQDGSIKEEERPKRGSRKPWLVTVCLLICLLYTLTWLKLASTYQEHELAGTIGGCVMKCVESLEKETLIIKNPLQFCQNMCDLKIINTSENNSSSSHDETRTRGATKSEEDTKKEETTFSFNLLVNEKQLEKIENRTQGLKKVPRENAQTAKQNIPLEMEVKAQEKDATTKSDRKVIQTPSTATTLLEKETKAKKIEIAMQEIKVRENAQVAKLEKKIQFKSKRNSALEREIKADENNVTNELDRKVIKTTTSILEKETKAKKIEMAAQEMKVQATKLEKKATKIEMSANAAELEKDTKVLKNVLTGRQPGEEKDSPLKTEPALQFDSNMNVTLEISKVLLWLDAHSGVSTGTKGEVRSWTDKSRNQYVFLPTSSGAHNTLGQSEHSSEGPELENFDGISMIKFHCALENSDAKLEPESTLFFVLKPDLDAFSLGSLPQGQRFFGHYPDGQFRFSDGIPSLFSELALRDKTKIIHKDKGKRHQDATSINGMAILVYRLRGERGAEISVNGKPFVRVSSVPLRISKHSTLTVGGVNGGCGYNGRIGEILVMEGALSNELVHKYVAALDKKWGSSTAFKNEFHVKSPIEITESSEKVEMLCEMPPRQVEELISRRKKILWLDAGLVPKKSSSVHSWISDEGIAFNATQTPPKLVKVSKCIQYLNFR